MFWKIIFKNWWIMWLKAYEVRAYHSLICPHVLLFINNHSDSRGVMYSQHDESFSSCCLPVAISMSHMLHFTNPIQWHKIPPPSALYPALGASHKLRHTNFMIFLALPPLSQVVTFLRPLHLVWRHIFCNFTPRNY